MKHTLAEIFKQGEPWVEQAADRITRSVLDRVRVQKKPKDYNAIATQRIYAGWNGNFVGDAVASAYQFGLLVSSGLKAKSDAERQLAVFSDYRKLEERHRPVVEEAFQRGCDTLVTREEIIGTLDLLPQAVLNASPYVWKSPSAIPKQKFLYGQHLVAGFLCVDAATTGVGKSTQMIADCLAMSTGRNLIGPEPAKKLKVWLWNGEDPQGELDRRIAAACGYFQITEADIGGRLYVNSGRDIPLVVVTEAAAGVVVAVPVVSGIKRLIVENAIDVLSIDPFVTTHGVSENDNMKMAVVAGIWAQIAHETGCTVHLVHHIRKGDGQNVSVEDMRGAGSLASTSRAVRLLTPMTLEEASLANIKAEDRFKYFKVVNGKSNLSARSDRADWRQLVSYPMGNGDGRFVTQDYVGVVDKWEWPSASALTETVSSEQLDKIKELLKSGTYREHAQAKDWAGKPISLVLGVELEDKIEKKKIERMIKAWIREGVLTVVERQDHHRELKRYIATA